MTQVTQRYAVNANLMFKSPEDLRFAPEVERVEREAVLLPIEIAANVIMNPWQSMCQCHLHLPQFLFFD